MLTLKGSSSVSRSAQLRNVLAEWKAGVAPIICALSMLLCFSPAATADSFNGWQGIESIMDGSEYPIPPEQDFTLNYGNAAPAAVPPATLRSYIPQPGAMAPAAQSYPPIYEMAAPGQHELQGHLMQDGRQRHVRHQTAPHTLLVQTVSQLQCLMWCRMELNLVVSRPS